MVMIDHRIIALQFNECINRNDINGLSNLMTDNHISIDMKNTRFLTCVLKDYQCYPCTITNVAHERLLMLYLKDYYLVTLVFCGMYGCEK